MMPNPRSPIPRGQVARYLIVGIGNTLFGYGCYALLTFLLAERVPESYIAASLVSNLISVTFSFLGYKWFVFRTKGNYLREWLRCVGVYSVSIVLSLAVLPLLVFVFRHRTAFAVQAPYIAGAIVVGLGVGFSFIGHKYYSFKSGS